MIYFIKINLFLIQSFKDKAFRFSFNLIYKIKIFNLVSRMVSSNQNDLLKLFDVLKFGFSTKIFWEFKWVLSVLLNEITFIEKNI